MENEGDHGESSKIKSTQKKQIERNGDVKRPEIDDDEQKQKPMSPKINDYDFDGLIARLELALSEPPSPPRTYSPPDPFPLVFPGETINIMDLLFSNGRECLIKRDGKEVQVRREYLLDKTIVLYLVPLNVTAPNEEWTTDDMLDAYNGFLEYQDTVFVFVGVRIVYASHFHGPLEEPPPEPETKVQESHFKSIVSTLPFPTIPFGDHAARKCVADAFKLHLVPPCDYDYLPYWSIIDRNKTVVASISDPGCYHLFQYYTGEELHPLTRENIQTVISQSVKPREMLSNLDQLLESFNRKVLLSSNDVEVPVSSLKGKIIGLYICDNKPEPRNVNLIRRVLKEADHEKLDFHIVQMCVRFHPTTEVSTYIRCTSPHQSLSEQQTIKWLELPFKDPRCKKLLRIFSYVCGPDCDDEDSVYGRLVIFQPKRDTFEFSGAEILKEYGIKGHPFTRERLFEAEKEIVKKTMKLHFLFPLGSHNLKRRKGDEYTTSIDNDQLYGKKVLVFYAFQSVIKRCGNYISMLKKAYDGREFEVVYVSFGMKADECFMSEDMPWLVCPFSRDFRLGLRSNLFKSEKFDDFLSGAAAFDENGELMTKFYHLDTWSDSDDNVQKFPFLSPSLEDAIRREVCSVCKLDEFSSKLG